MFGISMIAIVTFIVLFLISYFIYIKKPENMIFMYIPSTVVFIVSSLAVLYSFCVNGFEGLGIAFIGATIGIASLVTCIVLTIIVMIKQHEK
ncbi:MULTISPECIES: YesK family protein [Brevibacillus]|uniref:YesK family protein n=1 Tax=Brevibacillus TaxID=55080 RepID=UPI000B9BB3DA|nr:MULTISPECIES: YesK family protein [Brevibacillus]MBG9790107.1 membrane protein [Brevibacillus laterosporus]MED1787489.1 YesK family protein [Brevibacillus laterosporus]RFB33720.1 hypothetical protein DZB91_13275 [Brevibacillus sp. VP]